ncbi:hypothetical protein PCC7418_0241 [Halothece sp. PCC 7418]|uniref:M48 family metalloprotease n=1 Tax=Halothece sp. (strain PCC 7418) TaxID=65093 RepID=UPI0002A06248|nr:M48 family metalloprotease [Halothece sp. PCC 7418]AFZ42478.1 hypothetical protein PCC7418_0241 [Halothece sp. PCC 7418]
MSETILNQGEAALEAGDYQSAIAHLESCCQNENDPTLLTRAQKALVSAYLKNGNRAKAVALCRSLIQSDSEHPWALQILKNIQKQSNRAKKSATVASSPSQKREWRNAEGAKHWQRLKKPKMRRVWMAGLLGAIALFFLIELTIVTCLKTINWILFEIPWLPTIPEEITPYLLVSLGLFAIASPWLLQTLLHRLYQVRPLNWEAFSRDYPERARHLKQVCRQSKRSVPHLDFAATTVPLLFLYGHLPGTYHLVLSKGILEQISAVELGTLVAAEIGHHKTGDVIFFSIAVSLLQIPYTAYQALSKWGDQRSRLWRRIAAVGVGLTYGIYLLWRFPLLWLSKTRFYYSDRFAAQVTGDPNALTRALVKSAIGISEDITQTQHTPNLLEGFDLLLPISYQQGITIGSIPPNITFETALSWDCLNPYRHWLNWLNSHPLLGDRLYVLSRYAIMWKLQPELQLPSATPRVKTNAERYEKLKDSYLALPLFQSACLTSFIFFAVFKISFWLIELFGGQHISWVNQALPFLDAFALITFSFCIIFWINPYFPNIYNPTAAPSLPALLANTEIVPPDGQPIYLEGKLLGRKGINNWLGQDIILQTEEGLVSLQFLSRFGWIGNLLLSSQHLNDFVNETVTVQGWFRRTGKVWIDVDQIILKNQESLETGYPVWLTGLALAVSVFASYIILTA